MLFNSYVFILAFLPITLIGYFLLGKIRARSVSKIWLVGCSLFFYAYFNPAYLPIIVLSVLVNFALSQLMLRTEKKAAARRAFAHRAGGESGRAGVLQIL